MSKPLSHCWDEVIPGDVLQLNINPTSEEDVGLAYFVESVSSLSFETISLTSKEISIIKRSEPCIINGSFKLITSKEEREFVLRMILFAEPKNKWKSQIRSALQRY